MTMEITVIPPVDTEDFFERIADRYLELWDENGVAPTLFEVSACVPGYPDTMYEQLKGKKFNEYLTARRKEHLISTMASRLMAAQLGANMGRLAGEEIMDRLQRQRISTISEKDLLAIMKQGYEFAHKIDKDMDEIKGDKPQVYIDMRSVVTALPGDRQMDVLQEIARRFRQTQIGEDDG